VSTQWDEEQTIVWSRPEWVVEDEDQSAQDARKVTRVQFAEPAPAPTPTPALTSGPTERPEVEVDIRKVNGPTALDSIRRVFEIWTKNRVYILDASMRCIEVIDLATGATNKQHPFLGARCAGGRDHSKSELSFPLPALGGEAVFQKTDSGNRIKLSVTSQVVRVMFHASRVQIKHEQADHVWGKISTW